MKKFKKLVALILVGVMAVLGILSPQWKGCPFR